MSRNIILPSAHQLKCRARAARKRIKQLFGSPILKHLLEHRNLGLDRLKEKLALSLLLTRYMRNRKIRSVEELADRLFIGRDHLEAIQWMRSPTAFKKGNSRECNDEFLLALCGIDFDPRAKSFVFVGNSAN